MPKPLVVRRKPEAFPLAMDSGAFSFYTKHGAMRSKETGLLLHAKHGAVSSDYSRTPLFQRYFDAYCQFVRDYGHLFAFCASLDVIRDSVRSLELYREMRRQGLNVLPVYHYGEQVDTLRAYLKDADYIGIGGLVKAGSKSSRLRFLDEVWKGLLDGKGRPAVRIHAFSVAAFGLLLRHPYYSTDSTTPLYWARYGCLMMPKFTDRYRFADGYITLAVTEQRTHQPFHTGHLTGLSRDAVSDYVDNHLTGLDLSKRGDRYVANMAYMDKAMSEVADKHRPRAGPDYRCRFYMSGSLLADPADLSWLFRNGSGSNLGYLGTFVSTSQMSALTKSWHGTALPPASSFNRK